MATDGYPLPLWRRCELAWMDHLGSSGSVVVRLSDALKNTEGTAAPLVQLGPGLRPVRAPDFLALEDSKAHFWEVKYRIRPDRHPVDGTDEFWMAFEVFEDYLQVQKASGVEVSVALFNAGAEQPDRRWLRAPTATLREKGRLENRRGADGEEVRAWVWPAGCMEFVSPPAPGEVDLLDELEETRRQLGVPAFPRYSVVRIASSTADVAAALKLLEFGLRVSVITDVGIEDAVSDADTRRRAEAYRTARLLDWAEVTDGEVYGMDEWIVDGKRLPEPGTPVCALLEEATRTGGFNVGQFRVIHAPREADILVTAGAGTGKTETLSERVIYLLATDASDAGHAPRLDDIALITFSRASAAEMRRRLARTLVLRRRLASRCVLPVVDWLLQLSRTDVDTIHGYARTLLKRGGGAIGVAPDFRVSPRTDDLKRLIRQSLSPKLEALYEESRHAPSAYLVEKFVLDVWNKLSQEGLSPVTFLRDVGVRRADLKPDPGLSGFEASLAKLVQEVLEGVGPQGGADAEEGVGAAFGDLCLKEQSLPIGEVVRRATAALRRTSDPTRMRPPRHLLVDEFQDTDAEQIDLVVELRRKFGTRLFVVGDAKQGVYRFRGARGNAFQELRGRFDAQAEPLIGFGLTTNFRSGYKLLESFHEQFSKWSDPSRWGGRAWLDYRETDELQPANGGGDAGEKLLLEPIAVGEPRGRQIDDGVLAKLVHIVEDWRATHEDQTIAILARTNAHAKTFAKALRDAMIPCELRIGGDFFQTAAVKELRVLLEAVLDPADDAAILELCETRWFPQLSKVGKSPVLSDADSAHWDRGLPRPSSWPARLVSLSRDGRFFREDIEQIRLRVGALRRELDVSPTLAWIIEKAALLRPQETVLRGDDADGRDRTRYERCLNHLLMLLDNEFKGAAVSPLRVLEWVRNQISMDASEDEPVGEVDQGLAPVTALTVHSVKGLEFDRVIIPKSDYPFAPPEWVDEIAISLGDLGPRPIWRWKPEETGPRPFWDPYTARPPRRHLNVPLSKEDETWEPEESQRVFEEARLLYVAITRARIECQILVPDGMAAADEPACWADLLLR